jgi:acyl carrier protein
MNLNSGGVDCQAKTKQASNYLYENSRSHLLLASERAKMRIAESRLDNSGLVDKMGRSLKRLTIRRRIQMASTMDRVKHIIVELLGVDADKVTADARFREDLEADSLDLVELIMAFEEEFEGEISDEDAQTITTVGQAVSYVETQMATK